MPVKLDDLIDSLIDAAWHDGFRDFQKDYVERGEPSPTTKAARITLRARIDAVIAENCETIEADWRERARNW